MILRSPVTMRGLIFDFDGVIADSETLANAVLAKAISDLGLPTTLDDALTRYMGKRWQDMVAAIEDGIGQPLPDDFSGRLKAAILARFRTDLREVAGASAFIRDFIDVRRCIASSSSMDRLQLCLDVLDLADTFGGNVFSAEMVKRGKPAPDLFLLAAERMGIAPSDCIVIEDSIGGVRAGVAARMMVIGLCAGSHVRDGHAHSLIAAGATNTAQAWQDVREIVAPMLGR
jgi:beta-phosphoglucomutase-like phosphatase (HAD superfamily)